jgi:two-component system, sensor histidine kinase
MELEKLLREEQIRLLAGRTPVVLAISLVVSSLLSLVVWIQSGTTDVFIWLVLVYLFLAFRFFAHLFLTPPAQGRAVGPSTGNWYILLAASSGLVWAASLLFVAPESLVELVPVTLILCAMMGGSVSGLSYVRLAYVAYVVPVSLAQTYYFLFVFGDDVSLVLGGLIFFYMFACMYFGNSFHLVATETLRLRHENAELVNSLKEQRDIAEKANVDKSRFLAAASHDMAQPLHTLSLLLDVLRSADSAVEREDIFGKVDKSLGSLSSLFYSLLDISKLDAGVIEPMVGDFYIDELVAGILTESESSASAKGLDLRQFGKQLAVSSDPLLLTRIVRNLVANAINYSLQGGVLVSFRRRQERVLLQVWDTGVGIPADQLDDVFIEFKQLSNPHRDRAKGLGLGLAIVRRLCDLMGHQLQVTSRVDRGTVFSIELPLGDETACASLAGEAPTLYSEQVEMTVMVIDDEFQILQAMSVLLEKWGCQVLLADCQQQALELLASTSQLPDLIIADLRLRDNQTGIDAIEAIREASGTWIPGVIITGDTSPDRIRLVQDSGHKILHKPIRPADLRSLIQELLA